MNSQSGQALPLAIIALAIGALVVAPFLGHAGADLLGSRVYGQAIAQQSACDAGIEHAIWSLTKGDLAEQFTQSGDEVTYQLDETINGLTTSITVTANATGGGQGGDITDTVIDTLEFDNSSSYEPYLIHVSGNIYAIAYRGWYNRGYLKTVNIATNGDIGYTTIDTLTFDTFAGYEPCLVHVSGNIYAIAYRGWYNRGYLKTVSIATDGDIGYATIDTLTFDTYAGYEPSLILISGNIYAITYRGTNYSGCVKTISIDTNGDISNSAIDSATFDSYSYEPRIINVSNDIYAIAYRSLYDRGVLTTISIDTDGYIASDVADTMQFDATCYEPAIINISGNIYAIAYRGPGDDGFIKTVEIAGTGGAASYEIVATAGDRTIRALVNTDNGTATITSWRIE